MFLLKCHGWIKHCYHTFCIAYFCPLKYASGPCSSCRIQHCFSDHCLLWKACFLAILFLEFRKWQTSQTKFVRVCAPVCLCVCTCKLTAWQGTFQVTSLSQCFAVQYILLIEYLPDLFSFFLSKKTFRVHGHSHFCNTLCTCSVFLNAVVFMSLDDGEVIWHCVFAINLLLWPSLSKQMVFLITVAPT